MFLDLLEGAYPGWHARALCNGDDPAKWFPSAARQGNTVTREDVTREALEICARCPVKRQCRDEANERGEIWGIWGGDDREGWRRTDVA